MKTDFPNVMRSLAVYLPWHLSHFHVSVLLFLTFGITTQEIIHDILDLLNWKPRCNKNS